MKVDSIALRKRNVNPRPTEYVRELMRQERIASGKAIETKKDTTNAPAKDIFENEFEDEKQDSSRAGRSSGTNNFPIIPVKQSALSKSSLYNYKLKFSADFILAGITNNILINRYQPYQGGAGPIQLNNANDINFSFRVGVSDVMEDLRFIGGIRFGTTISDKDVLLSMQNYRNRIDWGMTYYRSNVSNYYGFFDVRSDLNNYDNMVITNLYQVNVAYPLNEVKSFRLTVGLRQDKGIIRPVKYTGVPDVGGLGVKDSSASTILSRIEYVHDNTINPTQNIWNGTRWKIYFDYNFPVSKGSAFKGKTTYNLGFDARHYYKIYRNFIWATRVAGDFSFGDAKLIYYLGGVDGWISPKFNASNQPLRINNMHFSRLH